MRPHPRFAAAGASLLLALALCSCSNIGDSADDASSVQGQWQVVGTMMTIVITDEQIMLPDGSFYDYEIDTTDKVMSFSVGEVEGQASYTLGTSSTTGVVTLTLTEDGSDGQQVTTLVRLSTDTSGMATMDGGSATYAQQSDDASAEAQGEEGEQDASDASQDTSLDDGSESQ